MKAVAIHATKNTPGKSDATGAFVPEARAFAKLHGCQAFGFDNTASARDQRAEVAAILARHTGLDSVAIFCHGLRRSLKCGYDMAHVGELADAIAGATASDVRVALYACSTGATDDGFAATLAAALSARGKTGWVDAHTSAGHATKNPEVRRFAIGMPIGEWLVSPTDKRAWKAWREALTTDLRFRFPLMTVAEVRGSLAPAARLT